MCYFGLEFTESRPLGATWALDALWNRLGIGAVIRRLLVGRHLDDSAERVLFALVAYRALASSSNQEAARWVTEDVIISGLPVTTDDACYQALGWLTEIKDALEKAVSDSITNLPDEELDLLFFDTTAACPETDWPQIVGMAVTRQGIPVRAWCWPQNTADSTLISQVREDMRGWPSARIVWVADRGFTSADSRRGLRADGRDQYIIGEKLRSAVAAAALSRQGRYHEVAANLRVKEVRISANERFIICHDPEGAEHDAAVRGQLLAQLEELIEGTDTLSRAMRAEKLRGFIIARHGRHPYLRVTAGGLLRIDAKAVRADEKLDGKYLLRASDPAMTAGDIALGYRRMLKVQRNWLDTRQAIDLSPAYHRTEEGIRAHVLLCWLALLLARVAENACHDSWPKLRQELDRIAIGTFTGSAGTFRLRTKITATQLDILAKLAIEPPPLISQFTPASSWQGPA